MPAEIVAQSSFTAGTEPVVTTVGERSVGVQFEVVDGDSKQALAGVGVSFTDQSGTLIGQITSDPQGMIALAVPDGVTSITATASEPKGYVAFPVTSVPSSTSPGLIPLYRVRSQWTSWGRTADRTRIGPAIGLPSGGPIWSFDAQNNVEFPPCLAFGLVLYGSYHGFLNANSQADGHIVWQVYPGTKAHPSKFANQVVVSTWKENGRRVARVYYADLTGILGCRDVFTGEKIWEIRKARGPGSNDRTVDFTSFESSPLIVGETLYVATRYSDDSVRAGLWAFDKRTGEVRWCRQLGSSIATKIGSSPAYANGLVYQATYDGAVFALDAATGDVVWRTYLGGEFYSTPAVNGTRLYIGNKSNGRMYCLNSKTGRQVWCRHMPATVHSSPALYSGRVYVGSGRQFIALKAKTGEILWRFKTATRVLGSATILRDVVYFSDFGRTYACNAITGKQVWQYDQGRYSPVTATDNFITVVGRRVIYAFKPSH